MLDEILYSNIDEISFGSILRLSFNFQEKHVIRVLNLHFCNVIEADFNFGRSSFFPLSCIPDNRQHGLCHLVMEKFNCLNEFVELCMASLQELRKLAESSETFSPVVSFLYKDLAFRVRNRYYIMQKEYAQVDKKVRISCYGCPTHSVVELVSCFSYWLFSLPFSIAKFFISRWWLKLVVYRDDGFRKCRYASQVEVICIVILIERLKILYFENYLLLSRHRGAQFQDVVALLFPALCLCALAGGRRSYAKEMQKQTRDWSRNESRDEERLAKSIKECSCMFYVKERE